MDLSCLLYIETFEEPATLQQRITSLFGGTISLGSISDEFIYIDLSLNDSRDRKRFLRERRFVFSKYCAEIDPVDEICLTAEKVDPEIYLDILMHIIMELRKSGTQVASSCEYEDLVAEKTGWNWSTTTPVHPPVATG